MNWACFCQAIDSRTIIILLLGCISFTTVSISIPYDLLGYMTHAVNIVNGHGYTYINGEPVLFRGPVFSLLIALSYKIFGISPESAFQVIRLFCIANPIIIYLFGRKLFNAKVGFAAALFIISSYSISYWSYRLIDASWPFFVILYCYSLYEGFERENVYLFVLAGISLAVAYLTKEVALLFFPLGPLMFLWIKEYRNKRNLLCLGVVFSTTLVVLLPWVLYLYYHHALHFLWGAAGPVVLDDIGSALNTGGRDGTVGFFESLFALAKEYSSALIYFYSGQRNTVSTNFIIAPLYLVGWFYVFVMSLRGDKGGKILILNLLIFLPIIYFIGKNHWRFGQVLFIMLISAVALAYFLDRSIEWFCKVSKISVSSRIFFPLMVTLLVVVQIFLHTENDLGYAKFFKKSKLYHFVIGESTRQVVTGPYFYPDFDATAEQLLANIKSNAPLLVDSLWLARRLFLYIEGKQKIFGFPMVWVRNNKLIRGNLPETIGERALFLTANHLVLEPQYRFYILFESQLISLLHSTKSQYVILSQRFRELEDYFSGSGNYDEVLRLESKDNNGRVHILYRVREKITNEKNLPLLYADPLVLTLNTLINVDTQRYQFIRNASLYGIASLSEEDVETILDSIVEIPSYHQELGNKYFTAGDMQHAMIEYKEAVRLDPENITFLRVLANFYREQEMRREAIEVYLQLIRIDPENITFLQVLAKLYLEEGMSAEAIEICLELNQIAPGNAMNHHLLGELYKGIGKVHLAINEYEQAVLSLPEDWYHRHYLGELYLQSGYVDQAIEQYTKLVELRPDFGMYSRILGDLYKGKGMKTEARLHYKQALSGGLDKTYYQQLINDLDCRPTSIEKF